MLASASFLSKSSGLFDRMLNIRQVTPRGDLCLVQVLEVNEGNLAARLYQRAGEQVILNYTREQISQQLLPLILTIQLFMSNIMRNGQTIILVAKFSLLSTSIKLVLYRESSHM